MQDIEQKIDLLLARQITKTRFATITVPVNDKGTPLGQGKCKAVVLHLNYYALDSADTAQLTQPQRAGIYYGDSNQQTCELLLTPDHNSATLANVRSSEIIFCNDLSEVWVRGKPQRSDAQQSYQLEVIIYE